MNAETITLTAGRELDAAVAREIFGVKRLYMHDGSPWDGKNDYPQYIPRNKPWRTHEIDAKVLPWFSRDMGSAWQIVEHIREQGFSFEMQDTDATTHRDIWEVTFDPVEDKPGGWGYGETPALAICRAALATCRPSGGQP